MSVSWHSSHNSHQGALPLALAVPGGQSTSSSDYGSWFQPRPSLNFPNSVPVTGMVQRYNPTRKLGALHKTDSETDLSQHRDTAEQVNGVGDVADQPGKVNSFLSKVTQEIRIPMSPQIPEMLDLPGRLVRAPKTRHMTPRNSPEAVRYGEMDSDTTDGINVLVGSNGNGRQAPRYGLERGNTITDISPLSYQPPIQQHNTELTSSHNPYALQRSKTMLMPNTTSNRLRPSALQPIGRQYAIPKFQLNRSNTIATIQSSSSNVNNQYDLISGANKDISPRYTLQRSTTMLNESKSTHGPPANAPGHLNDNRVTWNFRRIPSFHGTLPSGGMHGGIISRQGDIFQPIDVAQTQTPADASRYMFRTLPDSNAAKNLEGESTSDSLVPSKPVPHIPMYWLYGSRGRPGMREEITWAPANSPRDLHQRGQNQNGHIIMDSATVFGSAHGTNQRGVSESDFLGTAIDRRDAYRSNYSSQPDQRAQGESDKSEHSKDLSAAAMGTGSLLDEGSKTRSILKKNTSQGSKPAQYAGIYPLRSGPGGRLPHLALDAKRNGSKRVSFAM